MHRKEHDDETKEEEGIKTNKNKKQETKELGCFMDREIAEQSKSHGLNQHP